MQAFLPKLNYLILKLILPWKCSLHAEFMITLLCVNMTPQPQRQRHQHEENQLFFLLRFFFRFTNTQLWLLLSSLAFHSIRILQCECMDLNAIWMPREKWGKSPLTSCGYFQLGLHFHPTYFFNRFMMWVYTDVRWNTDENRCLQLNADPRNTNANISLLSHLWKVYPIIACTAEIDFSLNVSFVVASLVEPNYT